MSLYQLIPKDKADIETVSRLSSYSYEEIKPIIPNLLEWIRDMNWPVARPVADYLESISEHITDDIIKILQGNDDLWKYWSLHVFGLWSDKKLDNKLIKEINRIASKPTKGEIKEEVDEVALEILNNKSKLPTTRE